MYNYDILLTGARGFLGQHLSRALSEKGYKVYANGRCQYDLLDPKDVAEMYKALKPRMVLHAGARVAGIIGNVKDGVGFLRDNALMGIYLIEEGIKYGKLELFHNIGSCCGYPKIPKTIPFVEEEYFDGESEGTNAPYSDAKRLVMRMGMTARRQYKFPFITSVLTNCYGPGESFDPIKAHVVGALIRRMHACYTEGKECIKVYGDGTASRDLLYIESAVQGIIRHMEYGREIEICNFGSGIETSIAELATLIKKITKFSGHIIWDSTKPNGQPRRILNCHKALKQLGWEDKFGLEWGLRTTYDHFLNDAVGKMSKEEFLEGI